MSRLSLPAVGQLRDRVTVQERVNAPDPFGQPVPAWADLAVAWARVTEVSSGTTFGEPPEQATEVVLRYLPGLTPTCRLLIAGVPHHIASLVADPRRRFHTLLVSSKEV